MIRRPLIMCDHIPLDLLQHMSKHPGLRFSIQGLFKRNQLREDRDRRGSLGLAQSGALTVSERQTRVKVEM